MIDQIINAVKIQLNEPMHLIERIYSGMGEGLQEHGQLRRARITKQHSPLVQQILSLLLFFVWLIWLFRDSLTK